MAKRCNIKSSPHHSPDLNDVSNGVILLGQLPHITINMEQVTADRSWKGNSLTNVEIAFIIHSSVSLVDYEVPLT